MKYKTLLNFLRFLVRAKRFLWWLSPRIYLISAKFFGKIWHFFAFWGYRARYFFRRFGLGKEQMWWLRRDVLQVVLLLVLLFSALPQTSVFSRENDTRPGRGTLAYQLFGPGENYDDYEVIEAESPAVYNEANQSFWRSGAVLSQGQTSVATEETAASTELGTMIFSLGAVAKPTIVPGVAMVGANRKGTIQYMIEPGDSLSSIAYRYGLKVTTLMWANNLTYTSVLRLGAVLDIPPVDGVLYTIKKGDTLQKIANTYKAKIEEIITFNDLGDERATLTVGEKIMIPNGTAPEAVRPKVTYTTTQKSYSGTIPGSSTQAPSTAGYIWPSKARIITQYYSWRHLGLDVAGPLNTPNYAARAGTVIKSQCGWNNGYGCVIMIDHGNGVVTLYGHNNKLLVSAGDYVKAGQTIGLMGNTGNVRGVTGIHLHFEVRVNGVRVNPLSYVR